MVSSEAVSGRTISTSFITGGGFMKCIPMTRSGRDVAAASLVSEMDDVLLASHLPGASAESIFFSRPTLSS